ncbi:cbb3-type cytochrome oxidase assembly protein CcoS [Limimaricola cinnabarinus]|jgi:cbb3-type cytochrome oxidase maturation protein|uniref:Cbb3-type cytochrome oxidase assembly protein CcoS n=1 Tax=Limimaricola cinnabarinus TaxID=1125964 RepID=A0A2G1MH75_9RHOB|nr:cbb3-type cytochrome oxidase assembly protein CcoS [Limimaricola cinnabarinus]PHP28103.1 cbb3-type cytochrome oxidase assembly protein CcoS [Limimaricola cinnabarinus]
MSVLAFLIPVTLAMGALGLAAFFWSLRSGQYEDLTGDAERILFDADDTPLTPPRASPRRDMTPKETMK